MISLEVGALLFVLCASVLYNFVSNKCMFAIYESFYYGLHPSYFTFTAPLLNLNSCQASLIKWLSRQQRCEVVLSLNVWFQLDMGLAIVLCKDVKQSLEPRVFVVCFFQNISMQSILREHLHLRTYQQLTFVLLHIFRSFNFKCCQRSSHFCGTYIGQLRM